MKVKGAFMIRYSSFSVFVARRYVFLTLTLILATGPANGQPLPDTAAFATNTVFASGLGNGLLFSLNWDHRWPIGNDRWMSVSGGFTYYHYHGGAEPTNFPVISVPLQWNWFKGRVHHREHGAGLTYGSGWYGGFGTEGQPLTSQGIYLFAKPIGYRYQKPTGGFFFRLNVLTWVRIIELNELYVEANGYWETPPIFPWAGLDLGYTFRPPKTGTR
jgi:hypothetical protein